MVDVSTGSTGGSITVTGGSITPSITATSDTTQYWSNQSKNYAEESQQARDEVLNHKDEIIGEVTAEGEKQKEILETTSQSYVDEAKNWANKLGDMVDGVEYSAKHYAELTADKAETAITDIDNAKTTSLSEINTAKTQSLNEITTSKSEALTDIQETGIDTRANIDLSNLTPTGEKHFLNHSQVTNCITEIPQRIKYTLVDGVLTILKGSVCIVPYGTDDLTGTHPVGSTFINDNFKVFDTQYTNGKFFVWLELQNDISHNATVEDTTTVERFVAINISGENIAPLVWNANSYSGDTAPTSGSWQWYQLTNNKVVHTVSGSTVDESCLSLPILKVIAKNGVVFESVSKIFNGYGYIGSTNWVDKAVKALFPNGNNPDGTVNNIAWTNPQLFTYTFPGSHTGDFELYLKLQEPTPNSPLAEIRFWKLGQVFETTAEPVTPADGNYFVWYNPDTKFWQETYDGAAWVKEYLCPLCLSTLTNSVINNTAFRRPFVAADAQDLDGNWFKQSVTLVNNAAYPTSNNTVLDLSNILPKDNNIYEIILEANAITGTTSGNYCNCIVETSLVKASIISCKTAANASMQSNGSVTIPIGADKILTIVANARYIGKYNLYLKAYRKVR